MQGAELRLGTVCNGITVAGKYFLWTYISSKTCNIIRESLKPSVATATQANF